MSNSLDPDQGRHFVGLDLGPNCLQRLSADNTGRQRVKVGVVFGMVNYNLIILHLVIYGNIRASKFSFQILKRFSIKTMYVVPCVNGLCLSSLIYFYYLPYKVECLNKFVLLV